MFVTFFDTCMVSLAAMFVWRISPYWIFFPWLTIACLDGVYLTSALTKVPDGAWFTLTLAGVLTLLFILWRFGKEQQWAAEAADRFPTTHFVKKKDDGTVQLAEAYGGSTLSSIKSFGIFFDKGGGTTPPVFSQFVIKLVASPQVVVLFHLRPLETPTVPPEDRYTVSRLAIPDGYRLIVRHGFNDEVITPDLASLIHDQIRSYLLRSNMPAPLNSITGITPDHEPEAPNYHNPTITTSMDVPNDNSTPPHSLPTEATDPSLSRTDTNSSSHEKKRTIAIDEKAITYETRARVSKLDEAYEHQVLYIIGKEQMKIKTGTGIFRRGLLHCFLWIRENTRTKIANLRVPMERVFEVGFVKEV